MSWYYLSFAGEEGFRGAVVVEAPTFGLAVLRTTVLKINPHGEVLGAIISEEELPPTIYRHKLLSKEQIKEIWPDADTLSNLESSEVQ